MRTRSYQRHQWLIMVPSQAERAGIMATITPPGMSNTPASAMMRYSARLPSWKKYGGFARTRLMLPLGMLTPSKAQLTSSAWGRRVRATAVRSALISTP